MAGLEMRTRCERCGTGLRLDDVVFICSYECTFCAMCVEILEHTCPNCAGELVRRPRRLISVDSTASCDVDVPATGVSGVELGLPHDPAHGA